MNQSIQTSRHIKAKSVPREVEFIDEFGRKRKRILEDEEEETSRKVVNYMRPKAPGFYNLSSDVKTKEQQILAITKIKTETAKINSCFNEEHKKEKIQAARRLNAKVLQMKSKKNR